jgi:hypothetical protein
VKPRRFFATAFALLALGALAAPAFGDGNNPSNTGGNQTGYEGRPGNNPAH